MHIFSYYFFNKYFIRSIFHVIKHLKIHLTAEFHYMDEFLRMSIHSCCFQLAREKGGQPPQCGTPFSGVLRVS